MIKTNYSYRNLPCTESPNDWCVWGKTADGAVGVLEWCISKEDALSMRKLMVQYTEFKELVVMRFNQPDTMCV